MGELCLAGRVTKVRVERNGPGKLPHRFSLSVTEVIRIEGRKMKLAETRSFEFAAPNADLMKEWANSMHLWRRMNWKDNVTFFEEAPPIDHVDERALLMVQLKLHHEAKLRRSVGAAAIMKLRHPINTIRSVQSTPTMKKLKERVMSTASRTSSCATTTTSASA
jgi:hypothetical protein